MTEPLALVSYERLLPGTQLVNRLQDMKYRVQVVTDVAKLGEVARKDKPMVIFADLGESSSDTVKAVTALKKDASTAHIPVIAFAPDAAEFQESGRAAGAVLVVSDAALLTHLTQFLEQALRVE